MLRRPERTGTVEHQPGGIKGSFLQLTGMATATKLSFPFQYWNSTGIKRSFLQLTDKETACLKQATDDSDE